MPRVSKGVILNSDAAMMPIKTGEEKMMNHTQLEDKLREIFDGDYQWVTDNDITNAQHLLDSEYINWVRRGDELFDYGYVEGAPAIETHGFVFFETE